MDFRAVGVFEVARQENGHVDVTSKAKAKFWASVEDEMPNLKSAAGCYVFVVFNNRSAVPWYVGKAERQSFEKEIFALHKVHHYNEVLVSQRGTPYIFLIPRFTANGRAAKPTRANNKSIRLLETLLIGMALQKNAQLRNVRDTTLLRKLRLDGVLNSKTSGRPHSAVAHLRRALGVN